MACLTTPPVVAAARWWYHEQVEPTSQQTLVTADDDAIANALRAFVCALGPAAADVRLEFADGVATLTGTVASDTQRRAVEDLIEAHEAVAALASELRVVTPSPVSI